MEKLTKFYAGIGSRKTPKYICEKQIEIGRSLAEEGWCLRSGGAEGSDASFEAGCDLVEGGLKEIFLHKKGARGHPSPLYGVCDQAMELARRFHDSFDYLSEAGKLLIARNGYQLLGRDLKTPCDAVVCYTEDGKMKGGTKQGIRIAHAYEIPVINMGDPDYRDMPVAELIDYIRNPRSPEPAQPSLF